MMWSPMPTKYSATTTAGSLPAVPETAAEAGCTFTGQLGAVPE